MLLNIIQINTGICRDMIYVKALHESLLVNIYTNEVLIFNMFSISKGKYILHSHYHSVDLQQYCMVLATPLKK